MLLRRLAVLTAALAGLAVAPGVAAADTTITRTLTAEGIGTYLYAPFDVPAATQRIDVDVTKSNDQTKVGAGLYDERGAAYGSPGFRGIYGEEINRFFVATDSASRAFVPGPINPGTWTVIVPVFRAPAPTVVTVKITLRSGPAGGSPPAREPVPELVSPRAGWYRGDLHDHTTYSSDAAASGKGLDPAGLLDRARQLGLDWVSLTDHNVTAQNDRLRSSSPPGLLALGGEEVTNWFHGHSTATGMQSGQFYDWRWRPLGAPIDPAHEGRVRQYLDAARRDGVYTSAAHPFGAYLAWQFFGDAAVDPAALPDGLEVWNGPFQPDDEASVRAWDGFLVQGRRVWANGGSDVHGILPDSDVGRPTTVVYADALSRAAVVAALKAGRSYITSGPHGPELYLTATGPAGQRQVPGGTIYGDAGASTRVSVLVRGGRGAELVFVRDGAPAQRTPITADEQTVTLDQPLGASGFVRAELRGAAAVDPAGPTNGELGMRALTNPILLRPGPVPAGTRPQDAPPPPAASSSRGGSPSRAGSGSAARRCAATRGFTSVAVHNGRRGTLRVAVRRARPARYTLDVFAQSAGRSVLGERRVAHRTGLRTGSITLRPGRRWPREGFVVVRLTMPLAGGRTDVRRIALRRRGRRYVAVPAYDRHLACGGPLAFTKLERPVFGGRARRPLRVAIGVRRRARVVVVVQRGTRTVRRATARTVAAGRAARLSFGAGRLPPGRYRVVVTATTGTGTQRTTVTAQRL